MTHDLRWADSPDELISSSIYAEPAYLEMFAEASGASLHVMEGNHEGYRFTLPLLVRTLEEGTAEAFSAYGYGGVTSDCSPSKPLDLDAIKSFLAREGIVGAFIRHSPFLDNQAWLPIAQREFNRTCYSRELRGGMDIETFAASVDQKLRWSINRARKAGLCVSFISSDRWNQADILSFQNIYSELMMAKGTDPSYLFSEAFFLGHNRFGPRCELALVRPEDSGDILAAAFFLLDDKTGWVHYHLSASHRDRLKSQPMELLLAEASVHYGNRGFRQFHLGGGHAADGQDGLSRFKRKFSSVEIPFFISKWICNVEKYEKSRAHKPLRYPGLFLISDARGGS
jgi:hypothetical protein